MYSEEQYKRISRFHESAHATMAFNLGMQIDFIKLYYIEGDLEVCALQYVAASSPYATSMDKVNAMVGLVSLAGQYGTAMVEGKELTANYFRRFGASDDLRVAREHIGRYWRQWIPDVNYFMARYRGQVTALAGFLERKTYASGEDIERVLDSIPANKVEA